MMKQTTEWVRTSKPVIRSIARYLWTTVPAHHYDFTIWYSKSIMNFNNYIQIPLFQCFRSQLSEEQYKCKHMAVIESYL